MSSGLMRANVLKTWNTLEMINAKIPQASLGRALIRVVYCGVCGSDLTVFNHRHPTATVPRILGHEIFGVIDSLAPDSLVSGLQEGDRVVVHPLENCGQCRQCLNGNFHVCEHLEIMGLHIDGGFTEYVSAEAKRIIPVSSNLPDKIAALAEPFAVGFHSCYRAGIRPGDQVLIIGGGPIGMICGICARYFAASNVVIAEVLPERLQYIKSLGFDTIDAAKDNLIPASDFITGGRGFDKVIETSGSEAASLAIAEITRIRGTVSLVGIPAEERPYLTGLLVLKEIHIIGSRVHTLDDFKRSVEMIESLHSDGKINLERLIAREFSLEELDEAMELQKSGLASGKILIKI